ncbi:hypothetical protein CKJ80_00875 [Corynebacterium hadale]|uniref:alpha-amylase n=1 Tax=Corynebacterium hadale TaxID=2026255 RepID=A0AB36RQ13_9CORY|nr:hypothetical protein CKJ80_00875 [Corynebacterium hadale]
MRGNNKPARGLFSGMKRTVIASATALSLAVGGMAVPNLGGSLPVASAAAFDETSPNVSGETYRSVNGVTPLAKGWSAEGIANAPRALQDFKNQNVKGNYITAVSAHKKNIDFDTVELIWPKNKEGGRDKSDANKFRPGEEYYIWTQRVGQNGLEVLDNRVEKVRAGGTETQPVFTLQKPMHLAADIDRPTTLVIYGPGMTGPIANSGDFAEIKFGYAPKQEGSVNGTVKQKNGDVVSDAEISVDGESVGTTDANGSFSVDKLPAGEHKITVGETDFTEALTKTVTVTAGQPINEPFTVNAKTGTVSGSVTAPKSFTDTATVELLDQDGNPVGQPQTVGRGKFDFEFSDVPVGEYSVQVSTQVDGFYGEKQGPFNLGHNANETRDLTIRANAATIRGKVVDENGNTVNDATVKLRGTNHEDTTGSDGLFTLSGITDLDTTSGEYTLEVGQTEKTEAATKTVTVNVGKPTNAGEIQVELRKGSVSGRVTNEAGEAVDNATVRLAGAGQEEKVTSTDADGNYAFGDVTPGKYDVRVEKTAKNGEGGASAVVSPNQDVEANVVVSRNKGSVSGTAKYEGTNETASDIPVVLYRGADVVKRTTTGADGTFNLSGLDAGDYDIEFEATESTKSTGRGHLTVPAGGGKNVNATIPYKPATISGQVNLDGLPLDGVEVTVEGNGETFTTETDTRGFYNLPDLKHGDYTASIAGNNTYKGITVGPEYAGPGKTLDLNLSAVSLPGTITGTVVDDAGKPVEGAEVSAGGKKATTDGDGKYTIPGVVPGEKTVTVTDGDNFTGNSTDVTVNPNETTTAKDITVTRANGSIVGKIVDDAGNPVSPDNVTVTRPDGTRVPVSVVNGEFELKDQKPGKYKIQVGKTKLTKPYTEEKVNVEPNKTATPTITVERFNPGYTVTVLNDLGEPVENAEVILSRDGRELERKPADANGNVDFPNQAPGVGYSVAVVPGEDYVNVKDNNLPDLVEDANVTWKISVAPQPGSVTGTITDDAGNPVTGATVVIDGERRAKDAPDAEFKTSTTTGQDGTYKFASVPAGEFSVSVVPTNARSGEPKEVTVRPNRPSTADIQLTRAPGNLEGVVTNDAGESVNDAKVILKDADGNEVATAQTDANGKYQFNEQKAGSYTVTVEAGTAHEANSVDATITPAKTEVADVQVKRTNGWAEGTVVDETGAPVEGATVTIDGADTYTTDADGKFTTDKLNPGPHEATVAKTDEHGGYVRGFEVNPGVKTDVALTVNRATDTVNGFVKDDSGKPIEDVDVVIQRGGQTVDTVKADSDGLFSMDSVTPGDYTAVVAGTDEYKEGKTAFTVVAGTHTDPVEIEVQRNPGSVDGSVKDSTGQPLENISLMLTRGDEERNAATAKNGSFNFDGVPAGQWTLSVDAPKTYKKVSNIVVDVPANGKVTKDITLTSTIGSVHGVVTGAKNAPIEGATVTITNVENGASYESTTDKDGNYSRGDLSVGQYRIEVRAANYDSPEAQVVDVTPSANVQKDFQLEKTPDAPQTGTVKGSVRDTDGNAIDGEVAVVLENVDTGDVIPATVDANGDYTAADVPAGNYRAKASANGYRPTSAPSVTVNVGKTSSVQAIEMAKVAAQDAKVSGKVTNTAGDPIEGAVVEMVDDNDPEKFMVFVTNEKGEFSGEAALGAYTATVSKDDGNYVAKSGLKWDVTDADGHSFNVVLDSKPSDHPNNTGNFEGGVRDQEGKPVPGTTATVRHPDGSTSELEIDPTTGDFTSDDLEPGDYVVVVDPADGHRTPRYTEVTVKDGEKVTVPRIITPTTKKPIKVDKGEPGTINGWLVDDLNEQIPGAKVIVKGKGTDADGNPTETFPAVTVDKDGHFTTDKLPAGDYEVDLELPEGWTKPKDWPKTVKVTDDKPAHQGIVNVKAPRSEIKGQVVDGDGKPIDGVLVTVTDSHGDTKEVPVDKNGNYTMDVVPGDAIVEIFTPEGVQKVDPMYIPVRPGKDVELPTVNLTKKVLKLEKRVRGYDANTPDDAPGLPNDEDLIYGFIVTNESDVTVHDIEIEDPFAQGAIKAPKGWDGTLKPGEYKVFSAVMAPPVDKGAFANIAVARGKDDQDKMVASTPNEAYVKFMDMNMQKKVNARFATNADDPVHMAADEDLYFTYEVVNTGSIRMENVTVNDTIYEGDEESFDPKHPGKGTPMEIIPPKGFNGTLMPGERVVFKGVLPPLAKGKRHHNAAEAAGQAPEPPKRAKPVDGEPDYGEDVSGLLVITPKENVEGNAHIVVEEGAALPAVTNVDGNIWVDMNEDGKRDAKDTNFGGMDITLHSLDGLPDVKTTSDSDGTFNFAAAPAGKYTLQMRNPGGVVLADPLDPDKNENGIGAALESKEFEITGDEEKMDVDVRLLDRPIEYTETTTPAPEPKGSSLGKCLADTSSVSNPATWLIPIGILIAAMGGAAVLFEDEFNAAAAQFNQAMPSLNIQRPEWMNEISRQLAQIDPAVPAGVLAAGIIGLGALALGLTYASCQSGGEMGSSTGDAKGSSSKKEEKTLTTAAEPTKVNA